MNAERLLKLADFLDTVPPERFEYAVWASEATTDLRAPGCGTKACALGWATAIPEFAALGLRLAPHHPGGPTVHFGTDSPVHREFDCAQRAAMELFGIDGNGFHKLFVPNEEHDCDDENDCSDECLACLDDRSPPSYVAAKIRAYVAGRA